MASLREFVGLLLMAAGGLLATASGLCTGAYYFGLVTSPLWSHPESDLPIFLLSGLVFGVLPCAFGLGLVLASLGLFRGPRS